MKKLSAAFIAVLVTVFMAALPAMASVPNHTEYFYVNDFANVLSADTRNHIVSVNDDLHARTGAQVVITTVNFLNGADIEDYSLAMFNGWGIGSDKNNGLLLLLAIGENDFMIQRGLDLDRKLAADTILDVLDDFFIRYFDAEEYDKAVRLTFDELVSRIDRLYADSSATGTVAPNQPAGSAGYSGSAPVAQAPLTSLIDGFWSVIRFIVIAVIVIAVISIVLGMSFAGRRRYYGGPMAPRRRGWGGFFWGYGMGRAMRPHHHHHHRPHTHKPPSPGPRPGGGIGNAPRTGGGGLSSGGGIGRSLGGGLGGSRPGGMGGSRPMGGGPRVGGGGMSRGGGIGRR
jgi:uncharacterized protein